MDSWTLQKGYPFLQVERHINGTALLTQRRFLFGRLSSKRKHEMKYKWWIPITFTTQDRPSFRHTRAQTWLRQEDDSLQVTGLPPQDKWVIFNLQQTGYYRVNYDQTTWMLLISQLHTDHEVIFVTNRAQLIDDSMNLARTGIIPYNIALQLLSYLRKETEYVPWKAGLRNLKYVKKDAGNYQRFWAL
ncbi:Thyrotropin-releasing hormone-degrading ectoenzyme [Armadillidium vulgare]|nr:Thyrotropin-releasing hormone-degrading ectoenzyme [Armadillidium vulgare]